MVSGGLEGVAEVLPTQKKGDAEVAKVEAEVAALKAEATQVSRLPGRITPATSFELVTSAQARVCASRSARLLTQLS